ncbi:hypothetical protein PCC9214_05390 (plasmid) [Planktothrix tepida]|uniref:Uncharacterized protein n=1 Tax=Planktothrix tepida PCC 9214 TaxID=671072 RepID=A0A1J1LMW5_9CYAN|nr:hypothetical protein [Planktothrix tepida]CAD5988473.1 hypothetical protein PCC9214_05390 [Planktothrix tepida]CUR33909.1 hypothetical protein PL921460018 [Planktothrix tepida PCC 9214]
MLKLQSQSLHVQLTHCLNTISHLSKPLVQQRPVPAELAAEIGKLQLLLQSTHDQATQLPTSPKKSTLIKSLLELPIEQAIAQINSMAAYSSCMETALFHDLMDIRNLLISAKRMIIEFISI